MSSKVIFTRKVCVVMPRVLKLRTTHTDPNPKSCTLRLGLSQPLDKGQGYPTCTLLKDAIFNEMRYSFAHIFVCNQ